MASLKYLTLAVCQLGVLGLVFLIWQANLDLLVWWSQGSKSSKQADSTVQGLFESLSHMADFPLSKASHMVNPDSGDVILHLLMGREICDHLAIYYTIVKLHSPRLLFSFILPFSLYLLH